MRDSSRRVILLLGIVATSTMFGVSTSAEVLVEYRFDGNANDSSGSGLHGELVGDAVIEDGRLVLPGGLDNGLSIPLGDNNPFGGDRDWTISFDFATSGGIPGPLFSADGAPMCGDEDDECWDALPNDLETGNQSGGLNIFMWDDGTVATDFWFIGAVESELQYNDDEVHSYFGSYNAATSEYTQTINGEDTTSDVFVIAEEGPYLRDASQDRNMIGDESSSFGFDFNFDGFEGYFDDFSIQTPDATIVEYLFEGDANDSSGANRNGEIVGGTTVEDGRLKLPGGFENSLSIPLGEDSPFGGDTSWELTFEFQTVGGSTGPLFSADGSQQCEEGDFDCEDLWPENEETGSQAGSLNVYLTPEGELITDFWFIGDVGSEGIYNDDGVHTYVASYDAETGEFTQVIDGEDEAFGEFLIEVEGVGEAFSRDTSGDRVLVGDESNADFGFEFNPDGFEGFFDNLVIESGAGGLVGDFNGNGELDIEDVDQLSAAIAEGQNPEGFDLTGDDVVNLDDLQLWVADLKGTWIGDANLDGEFVTSDFVDVFQSGKYETGAEASWSEGDWNADLRFDTSDFVQAFVDGGFEMGPREAVQVVPEPNGILMLLFGVICLVRRRCSK